MSDKSSSHNFLASQPSGSAQSAVPEWLDVVREKVEGLRFGVIQLVVHDGRVTQIDRTEKTRLDSLTREG
jgi:hypothetical protein